MGRSYLDPLPATMTDALSSRSCLLIAATLLCAGLSGCAGWSQGITRDTFKPYTPEVVQGNFVSREQLQALRTGMPRAQVRDILGTPLVTSLFHADRWDYAFSIRRLGIAPQSYKMTVHFQGDQLSRIEHDELPSESEFVGLLARQRPSGTLPSLQATPQELQRAAPAKPAADASPALPEPLPSRYPPLEAPVR